MRSVRWLSALLSLILFAGCTTPRTPFKPIDVGPSIEAPASLSDAMVTLTVSDLHGFLDGAGTVVSQISPMMGGPVLKTMLGSKLGDPQLAGIAPSNGLAVVMLSPTNVFAVVEVAPAQAETYIQGLQGMGLAAKQQDGLLLVAKAAETLMAVEPLALKVQSELLAAKRSPAIRMAAKPAALAAENEELISGGVQQMLQTIKQAPGSNNVANVEQILEAELLVLLSLIQQVDALEIALEPADGAIHASETIQPVAGSRLAAYCNAPVLNDYNPQVQPGLLEDGVMELEFCMRNPDALAALFNGEVSALVEAMDLDPALAESWSAYMTRWVAAMGSTVCESIFTDTGKPFGMMYLVDVHDEDAMMDSLRTMENDLMSMGFFRLYESMGMPMSVTFEENVRQHAGVNIHRMVMDFSFKNTTEEQRELMESMMGDMTFELAICKDMLVYTIGGKHMDELIATLKSSSEPPAQLAARSAFPSGAYYYADFDVAGYFKFISSFMGAIPEAAGAADTSAMFEKFTAVMNGAEPIVMSGYQNNGRMKFCSKIPADLLVRFAQAGQMMVMETMQGAAAMQAEPPAQQQPAGPAPDGTLKMLDGTEVELSSHAGQNVVVLDFWASWCGPCRKGLPMVQTVADHFTGSDVAFYAVNLREDAEKVKGFFEEQGLTLPVALDDGTLGDAFGVEGIPHTVVIGKDGNIAATHTGLGPDLDAQLTAEINAALAE